MPSEFFDSEALTSSRPASVVPMVRLLLLLQSFTLCIVVVVAGLVVLVTVLVDLLVAVLDPRIKF